MSEVNDNERALRPWIGLLATAMTLATLAAMVLLWLPQVPLGIPGEWVWSRIPFTAAHLFGWLATLGPAGGYMALVVLGGRRLAKLDASQRRRVRLERGAWLAVLIAAAVGLWLGLLSAVPHVMPVPGSRPERPQHVAVPFGLGRSPLVLYYGRMSGYFWEARYSEQNTREFLQGYAASLTKREDAQRYLHLGTHPPGMILLHRGILSAAERFPAMASALSRSMPQSIRDANEQISLEARASQREFTARDAACLWGGTLLTLLIAAAAIWPLTMLLVRGGISFSAGFRWGALWAFVPAVCVFLPKCDALLPFLTLLAGCVWFSALDRNCRGRAFLAGGLCFVGLLLSLAFAPVLVWLTFTTLATWYVRRSARESSGLKPAFMLLGWGLAGLAVPIAVLWIGFDHNLLAVWQLNLRNHAEFYQHNSRHYGPWLAANVVELGIAIGPPIAVLACAGVWNALRRWLRSPGSHLAPVLGSAAVLLILWLSGKNMGEAARLWIPFLPWLLLAAAIPDRTSTLSSVDLLMSDPPRYDRLWGLVAFLQALSAILTSTRIDGFGFSELPL